MDAALVGEDPRVTRVQNVHVVTNRRQGPDGEVTADRSATVSYFKVGISVPENRIEGSIAVPRRTADPALHFAITQQDRFPDKASFSRSLWQGLSGLPANEKEVTVYVHGYNNTFADAAFRIAQLKTDLNLPGEIIAFSWASRASPLGYEYDKDSVLASRTDLADLLRQLRASGMQRIVLVGHSMGAVLAMEALRTVDLENPGFSHKALSGVVLISPDLDVDVFRSQARDIARLPEPFLIFTSSKDKALRLSARLVGEPSRLGNLSKVERLEGLPVQIIDVTAFAKNAGPNHFTAGSSPALLAILRRGETFDRDFLSGRSGPSGLLPGMSNTVNYPAIYVLGPQR
jgi:esterase/lipase superfamily enzyme